jgi:hypothetical protein
MASLPRPARSARLALAGMLLAAAAAVPESPADPGDRPGAPDPAPEGRIWYEDRTEEAGIRFVHVNGGTVPIVIYEQIPPGAAWLDYDGDGDLDHFAVQSGYRRFPPPAGEPTPTHRLYRNDGGPGPVPAFVDVTDRSGAGGDGYGMGAVAGDVDNDGDPDLFVTAYGPDSLYLNLGDGSFRDVTAEAGASDEWMSTSAAFGDVDGDGWLDLFVANYVDFASGPEFCIYNGVKSGCSDLEYDGVPDSLYLNLGPDAGGVPRFREAARERGVLDPKGRGLGAVTGDLDDDGDLDLYVANDGGANRLFLNDGRGGFRDFTLMSGAGYSEAGLGEAGMGTDVADYDGDGVLDIIVTNFAREANALYRGGRGAIFDHRTVAAGLAGPSFLPLGWGTRFLDADLDGDLDLFVANGHVYDVCAEINPQDSFAQRNQMFRNRGDGTFVEVTADAGPGLALIEVSRGAAFGDIDDDGDVDIWVANDGGRGSLLVNETARAGARFLGVALRGTRSNRDAVGARLALEAGGRRQVAQARSGGSYLSSSDPRLHFGVGRAERAERLDVRWPSGAAVRFRNLPADARYAISESPPPGQGGR